MNKAVAVLSSGSVLVGEYDGYGRIDGFELDYTKEPDLYHFACWKKAGEPHQYTGGSKAAEDQGHFIDPEAYEVPEPT